MSAREGDAVPTAPVCSGRMTLYIDSPTIFGEAPMSFAMSDEQVLLRDTARAFVARHCPPEQAKEWDDNAVFPAELWKRMAEMDWFALPYPEAWGGGRVSNRPTFN